MALGSIQEVQNSSVLQGIIKNALVTGVTTSTWNAQSGGTSRTVFKGTQEKITALAQEAKLSGLEYSISGGHIWTLEVSFPYDIIADQSERGSQPPWTWELINTQQTQDLWECNDRRFVTQLSTKQQEEVDKRFRNGSTTAKSWNTIPDQSNKVNAQVAFNLKRLGIRGKQIVSPTLKRTIMVPRSEFDATSLKIFPFNSLKVMTKSELLSIYSNNTWTLNNIPNLIIKAMPYKFEVNTYTNPNNTVEISGPSMDKNGINTFVGYLEYPPEYNTVSVSKIQITQHWVFNKWSFGWWGLYDTLLLNGGTYPGLIQDFSV
jgi:hypothetical protein